MEGKVARSALSVCAAVSILCQGGVLHAQQKPAADASDTAEISLRKAIGVRNYKGQPVEGSERDVRTGDTMWHILIREKGLQANRFKEYFVLVRGLNPQLQSPEILQAGDRIFIPIKPDDLLRSAGAGEAAPANVAQRGGIVDYTVRSGDHLFQILRSHLGITDDNKIFQYAALVKDLNPQKNNWDVLEKGERIRLPVAGPAVAPQTGMIAKSQPPTRGPQPPMQLAKAGSGGNVNAVQQASAKPELPAILGLDFARQVRARENFPLIGRVAETLGHEIQRRGEETVALKDGSIKLDKSAFPVVYNRKLDQRVILDGGGNIPDSLRDHMKQKGVDAPVVSLAQDTSLHEAVGQLLSRLGYQPLASERPVVIREGGVSLEAKGQWVVTTPEQSNKPQQIVVINLSRNRESIPEDLKRHLSSKGLQLNNIALDDGAGTAADSGDPEEPAPAAGSSRALPRNKPELVDALLKTYRISVGGSESLATELHGGLRAEIKADRTCEFNGQRIAIFFRAIDPAIKSALESREKIKAVELDFASITSRDMIAKILRGIGQPVTYKEHRFAAVKGTLQDRLVVTASGFLLSDRSLFVTDREIPALFQRVFFEKGLDIVYFQ